MTDKIRILHLEDDPLIQDWMQAVLPASGMNCEFTMVSDRASYVDALKNQQFDLILSDYELPDINGEIALSLAIDAVPDVPFILVSGAIGDEQAILLLKRGAVDYVLKDNLLRLVPAIEQALEHAEDKRKEKQSYEEAQKVRQQLKDIISNIPGSVYEFLRTVDGEYKMITMSEGINKITAAGKESWDYKNELFSLIVEPDLETFIASIDASAQTLSPWRQEFRIKALDGSYKWLRGSSIPRKQDDGSIIWHGILTDITLEKNLELSLTEKLMTSSSQITDAETQYRTVLDTIVDSIIIIDNKGIIQNCNPATVKVFGYTIEEMVGKNVSMLMPEPYHSQHDQYMQNYLSTGEAKILGVGGRELLALRKDGSQFYIELAVGEMQIAGKQMFTGIVRNIHGRKIAEAALQESEERFRMSQNYANIGSWDWNIQTGELYWSERIGPLFGYGEDVPETTYENFINAVHPDDRELVTSAVNKAVENHKPYEIEHRIVWQDGSVKWVFEQGAVTLDDEGKPLHMLGVVSDIDKRKKLEQSIEQQRQLLQLNHQGLTRFIGNKDFNKTSNLLLDALINVTESEYGFIGEVLLDESGKRYLKTHAITDISWSDETREFYANHAPNGMEFSNLDTLFGKVLTTGEVVISNDPAHDPRSGGLPEGHPDLNAFLGVPVYFGDELVGMYGVANREDGYDASLVDFLQSFDATYGVIINALRTEKIKKQTQHALQAAKEEAEKASQAKSEFLSSMSHELRTPLNAILGFGQLLELDMEKILNEEYKQNVSEILSAGKHLLELINEVLELAKIEAGKVTLSFEPVEFDEVFNECMALMSPLMEHKNITMDYTGKDIPDLFADKTRLKQVLINLLSNAVKYNVKGGSIYVSVVPAETGFYRINVTDTGPGIAKDKVDDLFVAFERLGAENSEIEGAGIGLVITQRMVELMNGKIGVETELGKGSTFWIELPVLDDKLEASNQSDPLQEAAISSLTNGDDKFHVLYIEDNPANLRLVAQIFERYDRVTLHAVHDPRLGCEVAETHQPDLILLDINMPNMNGYQVLEILHSKPSTKNIPVVAVSANAMAKDVERGKAAGFNDYLTKPLNIPHFMQIVERFLKGVKK